MNVAVIMGSISDRDVAQKVFDKLDHFGISYEKRVISAHRDLPGLQDYIASFEAKGIGVVIALAGKAAHLAGVIAGQVTIPVIGVPVKSSTLDGLDALLATVQMPSGVPVATVAIDGSENAAILAAQILALSNKELAGKLKADRKQMAANVHEQDKQLQAHVQDRQLQAHVQDRQFQETE